MSASAITLDFDGFSPGASSPLIDGDYQFDPVRIVNGNCDSLSGRPCDALNDNETMTLSRVDGQVFNLVSFWFQLLGNGTDNELFVTPDPGSTTSYPQSVWGNNDGGQYVTPNYMDVTSVTFSTGNGGNVRLDDFEVTVNTPPPPPPPNPVPVPAPVLLLLAGLTGLGVAGRRRKA